MIAQRQKLKSYLMNLMYATNGFEFQLSINNKRIWYIFAYQEMSEQM